MIKCLTYLSILILWGCNVLVEQTTPLKGDFYIQDGWLSFSSKQYYEADKHFNTARETNDERSIYHFLSSIGKGWTYLYNAKTKSDSIVVAETLVNQSGGNFDLALSILPELDDDLYNENDKMNLYAGITLQRAYSAKQKSANEVHWETENIDLSDEIDSLYQQSIEYSLFVEPHFIFQYDTSLDYKDIILTRIENYILIGEIDKADSTFTANEFKCSQTVTVNTIIECLCEVINDGDCPFFGYD